jgi:hypothetical protein
VDRLGYAAFKEALQHEIDISFPQRARRPSSQGNCDCISDLIFRWRVTIKVLTKGRRQKLDLSFVHGGEICRSYVSAEHFPDYLTTFMCRRVLKWDRRRDVIAECLADCLFEFRTPFVFHAFHSITTSVTGRPAMTRSIGFDRIGRSVQTLVTLHPRSIGNRARRWIVPPIMAFCAAGEKRF